MPGVSLLFKKESRHKQMKNLTLEGCSVEVARENWGNGKDATTATITKSIGEDLSG